MTKVRSQSCKSERKPESTTRTKARRATATTSRRAMPVKATIRVERVEAVEVETNKRITIREAKREVRIRLTLRKTTISL